MSDEPIMRERPMDENTPRFDADRRDFLAKSWKAGIFLIGAAGTWTSWDLLQPTDEGGLGAVIAAAARGDILDGTTIYVRASQSYLTVIDGEVIALWQRCPHLGCRVEWCASAGGFECACHGSTFNRAGEHVSGPSPRSMDRFEVAVVDDVVEVNTGAIIEGGPSGVFTLDEMPAGESCSGSEA